MINVRREQESFWKSWRTAWVLRSMNYLIWRQGEVIPISSLCTVFAESEVINYIGEGKKREDIATGVVDSVANKVVRLAQKKELGDRVILTGGLSHSIYFTGILSDKLDQKVESEEFGRFCGGIRGSTSCQRKKG